MKVVLMWICRHDFHDFTFCVDVKRAWVGHQRWDRSGESFSESTKTIAFLEGIFDANRF